MMEMRPSLHFHYIPVLGPLAITLSNNKHYTTTSSPHSTMPTTGKKPRTNKKKNKGQKKKQQRVLANTGNLPSFEEIQERWSLENDVLYRDGKEVLCLEQIYGRTMEMLEQLKKQRLEEGLPEPTFEDLKQSMAAKYEIGDIDVLNYLIKGGEAGDGVEDSEEGEQGPLQGA
ncbi:MAG: hypothetical protein SGILL_009652 [Bacillariaceae sp.]